MTKQSYGHPDNFRITTNGLTYQIEYSPTPTPGDLWDLWRNTNHREWTPIGQIGCFSMLASRYTTLDKAREIRNYLIAGNEPWDYKLVE